MSSKYTEAFDSLNSDDITKRKRADRILSAVEETDAELTVQTGSSSTAKVRGGVFSGKRGVALVMAMVFLAAVVISVPLIIGIRNSRGMLGAISKLKNTCVNMDGVEAFAVWNAPESDSASAQITNVLPVRAKASASADESDGIRTGDWSDEERYDWESDYDWDPEKANVLIAINDDGTIDEVVYERINGRGQVRQDKLGNAAMVYVSDSFTYVMYVDDDEWEFWKEINFAQEMRSPSGFHCHHEREQTVVIHNETGRVFALKDLIPQVNELSGATNYTMQVIPYKDDYLNVNPMYGNLVPQWYNVIYDEQLESIRYELMLPADSDKVNNYDIFYFVRAARKDVYGQQYLLEGFNDDHSPRVREGIVELPDYTRYGNTIVINRRNGILFGTDGRMYAFDGGALKVFGENFVLTPVEQDTEVVFEGVANEFFFSGRGGREGIAYKLSGGYLYSMFGQVWKVGENGALIECERLEGSFPKYADDGCVIGGEIISFVDTELTEDGQYSIDGRIVRIDFGQDGGAPRADVEHIIDASEMWIQTNNRMVAEQNENPMSPNRGETKYFLITVQDGAPKADYFGYGCDGGIYGLTRPITEPLNLS